MQTAAIQTAQLDWLDDPLGDVPFSTQFGDVYFSRKNGLLETRYVFLAGNDLPERLAVLQPYQTFVVGETGFGTGLNVLALWQLWRNCRPDNHSRLHVVTVEKYPLTRDDLSRALQMWPELADLSRQLLAQYPPPLAGPHRMIFADDGFSVDLWLGDAEICLPRVVCPRPIDAWFLDGFAPSCNPELWQEQVIAQVIRLSGVGTTFASFTVAGDVKRRLKQHGIQIKRPKGFGRKREMLKACWPQPDTDQPDTNQTDIDPPNTPQRNTSRPARSSTQQQIVVIGAGIAGLSCAWALARRGHRVTLMDRDAPLAGASGNPRALLVPKLTPLHHVSEHLHTLGWLSTLRWWSMWSSTVIEPTGALFLSTAKQPINPTRFADYPAEIAQIVKADYTQKHDTQQQDALWIAQGGLLNPAALKDRVLQHPLICFQHADVDQLQAIPCASKHLLYKLLSKGVALGTFDHVLVCNARQSVTLCPQLPALSAIRGQVSWLSQLPPSIDPPATPLSYGGYCAPLINPAGQANGLLFGASFIRQDDSTDTRDADHQHNLDLLREVLPTLADQLPPIHTWQGRASTRAQMPDYLPLVGAVADLPSVWVLAGLGSKGFSFAPLCAELLAAQMLGEPWPVSDRLGHKLRADRPTQKGPTQR